MSEKQKTFPVVGNGEFLAPNYARVARALDDDELQDELDAGRGDNGYRAAILAEQKRREDNE